jgi:predicted phage terminase large subunit-like protein
MPPQHGKSVGASTLLPAYMLGLNPDLRVAIASYSASLASKFNRRVQRILESDEYSELFPETTIKRASKSSSYIRTADEVEIIAHHGSLISVGREGSLTGNRVDCFILDDLYKDAMEANSPIVRENCREWYSSVVRTRMHNASQEIMVFTRWHEDDLIGTIRNCEKVIDLEQWSELDSVAPDTWVALNFEAIKSGAATEIDPRAVGEALWSAQHSAELLQSKRRLDPQRFECMYQGNPTSREGLLYSDGFATYTALPKEIVRYGNYTDTADMGDDYLCSICYAVDTDGVIYIVDVVYSREPMEVTEREVAEMLCRNRTRIAFIESNNGGRGFARNIQRLAPEVSVGWFHQSANKESRILSNASTVLRTIRWPIDWRERWPELAAHLCSYNRRFRSNRWHDAPDVLTGIVEAECNQTVKKRILGTSFKVRNYVRPKEN